MLAFLPTLIAQATDETIFGKVSPPPGVAAYDAASENGIGLILFFSRLIRLVTIAGGIFVMVNLFYAGWLYLSSAGNASVHEKAVNTIVYSIIGLAIIVSSYAAAGIAGMIFFGDATYILNPVICGPGGC